MRLPNGYGGVTKLSGRRRKPYMVRKTIGWHIDEKTDKKVQDYVVIGYAATKSEALQMLADYNNNPFDVSASKITFKEVYERWSAEKFPTVSDSNVKGYKASYKACVPLYDKVFKEIKLAELQNVVDTCGKNYPTLRKLKVLLNQLYEYAMKNELCNKDYSEYVDIVKHKGRNPNKRDREKFTKAEIDRLWKASDDKYYQIVLMLIYSGVRISEILNLKREDVNLKEQYFDVKLSIYRHLITGIHNVIISISRTKLHGKISGIAENRAPFSPPPGSYHHHPIHSPGSIKRCRSSIFQDINTFNIIGI